MAPKIHFGHDALLLHTNDMHILVGNGPSFMEVEIAATIKPDGIEEKKTVKNIIIHKKKAGIIMQLPDDKISYVHDKVSAKEAKEYAADVLVITKPQENIISKLKPKLTILMNGTVYTARELHKKTGAQVIAVQHGNNIDLKDYNAVSKQKGLSKFTEEK
jgi:hypothetical protein